MYIPIKNINELSLTNGQQNNKCYLFVDKSDLKLKIKFLDKVLVYESINDTNIDNEQSGSGSGNTSSVGGN